MMVFFKDLQNLGNSIMLKSNGEITINKKIEITKNIYWRSNLMESFWLEGEGQISLMVSSSLFLENYKVKYQDQDNHTSYLTWFHIELALYFAFKVCLNFAYY